MEKFALKKQLFIIRLYFSGFSFRDIAEKAGVSPATVTNIVNDLKAGKYPEASDLSGHSDLLRDTSVELHKGGLSPSDAFIGLTLLNQLKELGIEPKDIQRFTSLCKSLVPEEVDAPAFSRSAMEFKDVVERIGLSPEELINKVKNLEEQASKLEPLIQQVENKQKQLKQLQAEEQKISDKITKLKEQDNTLTDQVKYKEKRKDNLLDSVTKLEKRAYTADEQLTTAREDLKILTDVGMSPGELSLFTERIKSVVQHHDISPDAFMHRLFDELEHLGKGLGLETMIQSKECELQEINHEIAKAEERFKTLTAENQQLEQQQTQLRAQIKAETQGMKAQIKDLGDLARRSTVELKSVMRSGLQQWQDEFAELSHKKFALGKEFGQLQTAIDANEWVRNLQRLMKGDDRINANQVRVIGLQFLYALSNWFGRNYANDISSRLLIVRMNETVKELEQWQLLKSLTNGSTIRTTN